MADRVMFAWVLIVLVLLCGIYAKKAEGSIKFDTFVNNQCILLMRHGFSTSLGKVDFSFKSIGKYSEDFSKNDEKSEDKVPRLHLSLLLTDESGHRRIEKVGVPPASGEYTQIEITTREIQKVTRKYEVEYPSLSYLYLCDPAGEVKSWVLNRRNKIKEQRNENEKTGSDSSNILSPNFLIKMGTNFMEMLRTSSSVSYTLDMHALDPSSASGTDTTTIHGHHSSEYRHTIWLSLLASFGYLSLLVLLGTKILTYRRQNESLDYPLLILWVSSLDMLISCLCRYVYMDRFANTGLELHWIEGMNRLFAVGADVLVSVLFMMCSKGWGVLKFNVFDRYEMETVVCTLLLLARYVWNIFGIVAELSQDGIYHFYDGPIGKLELIMTIIFSLWFVLSIRTCKVYKQPKYVNLYHQLFTLGVLYYFIRPILILLDYFSSLLNRHAFSFGLNIAMHFLVCALAGYTFTNKRGVYMRVSLSNSIELAGDTRLQ